MNWVQELLALQKQYKMYPLVSFSALINNDSSLVLLLLLTLIIVQIASSRTVSRSKMTASLRSAILAGSVSEDDEIRILLICYRRI